jgi:hypothetical protein
MKHLLKLLVLSAVLSSFLAGCDLFNPEEYAEDPDPVDSIEVFHNLVNAYNTLDYEAFLLCLDSTAFRFIPRDTNKGTYYQSWWYDEEDKLTLVMFEELKKQRRIPPLLLQVDTTYFSSSEDSAFLHANYLLITTLEGYDTLGGGFEVKMLKRGNYWYISRWEDVEGETLFVEHEIQEGEPVIDTIPPLCTDSTWGDLKVHFRIEAGDW